MLLKYSFIVKHISLTFNLTELRVEGRKTGREEEGGWRAGWERVDVDERYI